MMGKLQKDQHEKVGKDNSEKICLLVTYLFKDRNIILRNQLSADSIKTKKLIHISPHKN
jgi:hypothetical protein